MLVRLWGYSPTIDPKFGTPEPRPVASGHGCSRIRARQADGRRAHLRVAATAAGPVAGEAAGRLEDGPTQRRALRQSRTGSGLRTRPGASVEAPGGTPRGRVARRRDPRLRSDRLEARVGHGSRAGH